MTINCKGKLIDLSSPKVMGILNITPDSFYDGGAHKNETEVLKHVAQMLNDGATFIDVGAYSSRPNAGHVSEADELKRILPIVALVLKEFPETLLSIDTFRSQVAKQTIEAGACMVNDISAGLLDKDMLRTVAKLGVPYIMMHMRGTPKTMQQQTDYNNLVKDLLSKIKIEDALMNYIANITHNTRNHAKLYLGASPRASLAMAKSAKAMAAIRGRDFITPDDIQSVAHYVLNHRIILTPEAEMEGLSSQSVIEEIIHKIEVPR